MKKKIIVSLLLILLLTGCGCSIKTNTKNDKPYHLPTSTSVGYLYYYVPADFTYRPDLRGFLYNENEKKVYMKGDYENDPDNVISMVVHVENMNKSAKQYAGEINEKLSDIDVKYTIKSNELITEIYARENYVIGNAVNYAYILDKEGYIHILNIKGPKDKADEIAKIVYDIYYSLKF